MSSNEKDELLNNYSELNEKTMVNSMDCENEEAISQRAGCSETDREDTEKMVISNQLVPPPLEMGSNEENNWGNPCCGWNEKDLASSRIGGVDDAVLGSWCSNNSGRKEAVNGGERLSKICCGSEGIEWRNMGSSIAVREDAVNVIHPGNMNHVMLQGDKNHEAAAQVRKPICEKKCEVIELNTMGCMEGGHDVREKIVNDKVDEVIQSNQFGMGINVSNNNYCEEEVANIPRTGPVEVVCGGVYNVLIQVIERRKDELVNQVHLKNQTKHRGGESVKKQFQIKNGTRIEANISRREKETSGNNSSQREKRRYNWRGKATN